MEFKLSRRNLSIFSLVMINVIAINSIRNLPMNASMGGSLVFYYLAATLFFLLPCVLVTAELATHYPKTGGMYIWTRQAFGPLMGFVHIFWLWIYNIIWFPTSLSFIAATILYAFNPAWAANQTALVGIVMTVFLAATALNAFGVRVSSAFSVFGAVLGTLFPMGLIIFLGAFWYFQGQPLAISLQWQDMIPNVANSQNLGFVIGVLFSLMGIEMSAVYAGYVDAPQRNFPKALFISLIIIVTSQILASLGIAMVLPKDHLSIMTGITQVLHVWLGIFHLQFLLPVILGMILLGAFGSMSAWVLGPAQGFLVALKETGVPNWMLLETKAGAPLGVLVIQALVVCALSGLFLSFHSVVAAYWVLIDLSGQIALLYYILLFSTALRLRANGDVQPGAYRIPGGKLGLWITCLTGIATCVLVMVLGMIPPSVIPVGSVMVYESILGFGLVLGILLPLGLYQISCSRKSRSRKL